MKAAQLQSSAAQYLYEGTVGAGLPIISTLQGLLNTGDKIRRIEGIFQARKAPKVNDQKKKKSLT